MTTTRTQEARRLRALRLAQKLSEENPSMGPLAARLAHEAQVRSEARMSDAELSASMEWAQ
jgi:hypothetical protein